MVLSSITLIDLPSLSLMVTVFASMEVTVPIKWVASPCANNGEAASKVVRDKAANCFNIRFLLNSWVRSSEQIVDDRESFGMARHIKPHHFLAFDHIKV